MSGHACCRSASAAAPAKLARRGAATLRWLVPGAALVLTPKCPACLAGYFAVAGIGVSAATASYLRVGLLAFCAGALVYLTARAVRRRWLAAQR